MKKILLFIFILLISGCSTSTKKLDINSSTIQNLYEMVSPEDDATVLKYLYENTDTFNNQYIISMALKNFISKESEPNKPIAHISKEDIEKNIYKIFGNNISFHHEKAYVLFNNYCGFNYNNEAYELIPGCGGSSSEKFYRQIIEASKTEDKIIILEKSIYVYNDFDSSTPSITIYNNVTNKDIIKKSNSCTNININIDDYLDKASTYQYTFKKVGKDYIFASFDLVN